jgi:ABC-type transporter Mla subunit MlaD
MGLHNSEESPDSSYSWANSLLDQLTAVQKTARNLIDTSDEHLEFLSLGQANELRLHMRKRSHQINMLVNTVERLAPSFARMNDPDAREEVPSAILEQLDTTIQALRDSVSTLAEKGAECESLLRGVRDQLHESLVSLKLGRQTNSAYAKSTSAERVRGVTRFMDEQG